MKIIAAVTLALTVAAARVGAQPKPVDEAAKPPANLALTSPDGSPLPSALQGLSDDTAAVAHTWQLKGTKIFSLPGGVQLSASLVGRRGGDLPLYAAESAGGTITAERRVLSVWDANTSVLWDTQIRAVKRIKSSGTVHIDAIGEILNLVNVTPAAPLNPTASLLTSRALRAGISISY